MTNDRAIQVLKKNHAASSDVAELREALDVAIVSLSKTTETEGSQEKEKVCSRTDDFYEE